MDPHNKSTQDQAASQPPHETHIPDAHKLVQQHLQDEHHQLTDEDLRRVQISTETNANLDELPNDGAKPDDDSDTDLDKRFVTPWDVTT